MSLLPLCGKVFERLMFKETSKLFIENDLISSIQSGFKSGYCCINQLISITHEIYKSFDEGLEVRNVFFDKSEAFDNVWHGSIIFKLTQIGISGNLLNLSCGFLTERKQ